jgi:omega-amidase
MKVALYQSNPTWLDQQKNLDELKNVINSLSSDVDLLILPEMFNTAYIMKPEEGAELIEDSFTIAMIREMLHGRKLVVGGTMPTTSEGKFHNTFLFINETGVFAQYDKIHLFTPAGEGLCYTSGEHEVTFSLNDIIVKPLICYDLRFPYISFQKKDLHHDILIYSANWPEKRIQQWVTLLQARAIENQCYVIGVNRIGIDENGFQYPGKSIVVDYSGKIVLDLGNEIKIDGIDLDFKAQNIYRKALPFLNNIKTI